LGKSKNAKHLVEEFRSSAENVGKLYPVLEDSHGNVIDGQHRLEADVIIRLIGNVCRRSVPAQEKTDMLDKIGSILVEEGFKPGEIAEKITEDTGMSYRWVVKYLPDKYKDPVQSGRRSHANPDAHHATEFLAKVLEPPKRKDALKISKYRNSDFVLLMLDRSFYSEFEKDCLELEMPPEYCVMKSLEEHDEKVRRAIRLRKRALA